MRKKDLQKKLWSVDYKRKLVVPEEWQVHRERLKEGGKRLATINGSFDLLHAGHLHILYEAAQQADHLMVAVNSDASVQQYKGKDRPLIPLEYRLQMLAMLSCVDTITWFDEVDPKRFLEEIRPHVHVNGSEYGEECLEAETVRKHGGTIYIVDRIPGLATSDIVKKITAQVHACDC